MADFIYQEPFPVGEDKGMAVIPAGVQRGDERFSVQGENIVVRYDHDLFPAETLGDIFFRSGKNTIFNVDWITVFI